MKIIGKRGNGHSKLLYQITIKQKKSERILKRKKQPAVLKIP